MLRATAVALFACAFHAWIFVVGGIDANYIPFNSVEALDLSVDGGRWEEKAPMPTARLGLAVAASGTKLFAVGGSDGNRDFDALEIYESATDSWSAAAPMPTALSSTVSIFIEASRPAISLVFVSMVIRVIVVVTLILKMIWWRK